MTSWETEIAEAQDFFKMWTISVPELASLRDRHLSHGNHRNKTSQIIASAAQLTIEARRPGQARRAPWIGTESLS